MGEVIELQVNDIAKEFRGYDVPVHTQGALYRYIVHRLQPGSFLTAVLSNDLFGAVGKADDENIAALHQICKWIYNNAPANCWGNKELVTKWLNGGGEG